MKLTLRVVVTCNNFCGWNLKWNKRTCRAAHRRIRRDDRSRCHVQNNNWVGTPNCCQLTKETSGNVPKGVGFPRFTYLISGLKNGSDKEQDPRKSPKRSFYGQKSRYPDYFSAQYGWELPLGKHHILSRCLKWDIIASSSSMAFLPFMALIAEDRFCRCKIHELQECFRKIPLEPRWPCRPSLPGLWNDLIRPPASTRIMRNDIWPKIAPKICDLYPDYSLTSGLIFVRTLLERPPRGLSGVLKDCINMNWRMPVHSRILLGLASLSRAPLLRWRRIHNVFFPLSRFQFIMRFSHLLTHRYFKLLRCTEGSSMPSNFPYDSHQVSWSTSPNSYRPAHPPGVDSFFHWISFLECRQRGSHRSPKVLFLGMQVLVDTCSETFVCQGHSPNTKVVRIIHECGGPNHYSWPYPWKRCHSITRGSRPQSTFRSPSTFICAGSHRMSKSARVGHFVIWLRRTRKRYRWQSRCFAATEISTTFRQIHFVSSEIRAEYQGSPLQ